VSDPHDWRPSAPLSALRARAQILATIRAFFAERAVLEVETPYLSSAGTTDPHIDSFELRFQGPGPVADHPLWLHTSPEFPMKRLLAAGSGPIYQLGRVFRQGEVGRRHNPEFTLLEWYRPGWDHHQLMDEVEALVQRVLGLASTAAERLSYAQAFQRHLGIDPHYSDSETLQQIAIERDPGVAGLQLERDGWLDLLLTHYIEPHLGVGRPTLLMDYPPSQAALARIRPGEPPVAERFELYIDGLELANGFHELGDAGEQAARFRAEQAARRAAAQPEVAADQRLLAALAAGLPPCAGVALGVDRLVMVALGASSLAEVVAFPLERA